ncbi:MAG: beta-galactosidase [Candidatus Sumerlaeota bacterium]|nr:beta-galactosidase [Candidatus Sumerlaeota bacterium]
MFQCIALVAVFLGLCSFFVFPTAAPAETTSPMTGFYTDFKIPENDEQAEKTLADLQNSPYINGVLMAIPWNEVEPAEGQYDFSRVDQAIDVVHKAGKKYKLMLMPGWKSPAWIYDAGAERFETVVPNPNRSTFGSRPDDRQTPWRV